MKPSNILETLLRAMRKIIPNRVYKILQPLYHYALAFFSALRYCFPSKDIDIIAVTGTKGKSSVTEIINAILEEAGYKTALSSTIRFKIGEHSEKNLHKMTLPGRFFLQRFLRNAVNSKCDWAIIELTSEGAKQFRHKFVSLNSLIFTNLSPEHIESHGSFENYLQAKLSLSKAVESSRKKNRSLIANIDDEHGEEFLDFEVPNKYPFSIKEVEPFTLNGGIDFTFHGKQISSRLCGEFNLYNILASIKFAENIGISEETIVRAVEKFDYIPGRVETIHVSDSKQAQDFSVIVDYAHTADSLEKLYTAFNDKDKICVLGGCGGGRDIKKRKDMGRIAEQYCKQIILTDEDPYDEDPEKIIRDIMIGIKDKASVDIIMDRKKAIGRAIGLAEKNDVVLITGKGTDPYIMKANGKKSKWSDSLTAKEELGKLLN